MRSGKRASLFFQTIATFYLALQAACGGSGATISNQNPPAPPVVSVTLSPGAVELGAGLTQTFTATVMGSLNTVVSWSVDSIPNGNAAAGVISGTGNTVTYTAPDAAGNHTLTATSGADPGKSASAALTIKSVPPIVSVALSPGATTLIPSGTQSFSAVVSGAVNTAVAWSVDGVANGNASVGTISGTGNSISYKAPNAEGSHTLMATSMADSSKSASAVLTIKSPAPPPPAEISVTISPSATTLASGVGISFTAAVTGSTNTGVTWFVDGTANGSDSTGIVTGTGNTISYTAPNAPGSHVLKAVSKADPTKSGSASITITPAVIGIAITPTSAALTAGGSLSFSAAVSGSANTAVTWFVDDVPNGNASIGTVTGAGNTITYTAPATPGSHVLKATSKADSNKSATAALRITAPVVSVALSPTSATVAPGGSQPFKATVSGSTNTAVTWTVDGVTNGNAAIGTISGTGNTVSYIAPNAAGNHTVAATSGADPGKSASAAVSVQAGCAPTPASSRVVSVQTYGAKGDGRTDDTAAIQSAVNDIAGTGGTVRVPSGTYMVNARATSPGYGIRLGDNMTLKLEQGAVLRAQPTSASMYIVVLASGVSNVNIVGSGAIEGDLGSHDGTAGEGGYCVQISNGSSHVVVEGITTREAWGDGFYIDQASYVTLCNVTADHNRRQGISIVDADQVTVRNSTFSRSLGFMVSGALASGIGLDIEPNPGNTVSNVKVTGCTFRANVGGGINASVPVSNSGRAFAHDIVFDGNTISNNAAADQPQPGINISGTTTNQWITNNTLDGNTSIGILLRSGATGIHVTGNTVNNTKAAPNAPYVTDRPGYGILVTDVGGNTITGNKGSGNAGCGVCELRPTSPNTISDNQVGGSGNCP